MRLTSGTPAIPRSLSIIVMVVVTATSALVAPVTANAKTDERPPRIVLHRENYGGDFRILLSNASGSRQRRLTFGNISAEKPRWSPYGKRILYLRGALEGNTPPAGLMVMGARGRHKQMLWRLRGDDFIEDMAWGPRGSRIVLAMNRKNTDAADLFVFTVATRSLVRLHVANFPDRYITTVAWSPDGKTIAFSAVDFSDDAQEDSDVYFVRPNGSGLRQVTTTPHRSEENPRWSPNGRRLAYNVGFDRCRYIVTSNADGTAPHRVRAGCSAWAATWSPNSQRLLVEILSGRRLREEIWTMARDGSQRRFIAVGAHASWRPR